MDRSYFEQILISSLQAMPFVSVGYAIVVHQYCIERHSSPGLRYDCQSKVGTCLVRSLTHTRLISSPRIGSFFARRVYISASYWSCVCVWIVARTTSRRLPVGPRYRIVVAVAVSTSVRPFVPRMSNLLPQGTVVHFGDRCVCGHRPPMNHAQIVCND